jgi:hypothetical protein
MLMNNSREQTNVSAVLKQQGTIVLFSGKTIQFTQKQYKGVRSHFP